MLAGVASPEDNGAGAFCLGSISGRKAPEETRSIPDKDHTARRKESAEKNHTKGKQPRSRGATIFVSRQSYGGGRQSRPEYRPHVGRGGKTPDSTVHTPEGIHEQIKGDDRKHPL